MWLTIYTSKSNLSLDARFFPNAETDGHHFPYSGPAWVFRIPGLCFRCTRVSFPKTFKTENRKMSGNSIRYPCTVKYLWLGSMSARAILKLALKIYFAMNCNDKFNETFSLSAGTGTIAIKAPMNNKLWIFRLTGWAHLLADTMNNELWISAFQQNNELWRWSWKYWWPNKTYKTCLLYTSPSPRD